MSGSTPDSELVQRLIAASGDNPHLAANVLAELAVSLFKEHPVKNTILGLAAEARLVSSGDVREPFEYLRGIIALCVRDATWAHTQDGDLSTRIGQDAAATVIAGLSPKVIDAAVGLSVDFLKENPTWLAVVVEEGEQA